MSRAAYRPSAPSPPHPAPLSCFETNRLSTFGDTHPPRTLHLPCGWALEKQNGLPLNARAFCIIRLVQNRTFLAPQDSPTEWIECMSHRKRRKTKQQPSMLPCPAVTDCCLVSFHFLCDIHSVQLRCSLRLQSQKNIGLLTGSFLVLTFAGDHPQVLQIKA